MPFISGPVFLTADPAVARWLERGLTLLLDEARRDGKRDFPQQLFDAQSQLHALADPESTSSKANERDLLSPKPGFVPMGIDETSERLQVTPQTVRTYCRDKALVSVKVGGQWRIHPSSVEQLEAK